MSFNLNSFFTPRPDGKNITYWRGRRFNGVSPARIFREINYDAFVRPIEEYPQDEIEAITNKLGKGNPNSLTGFKKAAYHYGIVVLILALILAILGVVLAFTVNIAFLALTVVGTPLAIFVGMLMHQTKDYARPLEIRVEGFAQNNHMEAELYSDSNNDEVDALRLMGTFPRGDRTISLNNRVRLQGSEACPVSFEFGVYAYEKRQTRTDSKGNTTTYYTDHKIEYLFFPHPTDVEPLSEFKVTPKSMFSKGDISLSAAFERKFKVELVSSPTDDARIFITRILAPDVQELILQLENEQLWLVFTREGVIVSSKALFVEELSGKAYSAQAGAKFHEDMVAYSRIIHEIYEQMNPFYKQLEK